MFGKKDFNVNKNNASNLYEFCGYKPQCHRSAYIAPTAVLIGNVIVGENSSVWFGTVLRGDINKIQIGANTNIQDGSIVHVDNNIPCIIGDNVTIGHSVVLHACEVGNNVRVGIGAIVLDGAKIEDGAQIAAGSVVPPNKVIKKNSLYLGIPAKRVREHTPQDNENITNNAKAYVNLIKKYF